MTDLNAQLPLEDASIRAVVLRAVPCARHNSYQLGCPDCLTGEQAAALGVSQRRENLGVISGWKWGRVRFSPFVSMAELRASRRIRLANDRLEEKKG